MTGAVVAVSKSAAHKFSKRNVDRITLVEGIGVEGDAHSGATIKHRSRLKKDPTSPNLRQVHLIHAELFDELKRSGFSVLSGQVGENITTRGIDLLALPAGTLLEFPSGAMIEVTGLRNPCVQLDRFAKGLMAAVLEQTATRELVRKAGIMAVVRRGGDVEAGDTITVSLPQPPHRRLQSV